MKKAVILIAGMALVGFFALPLFAHGPGWGGHWRGGGYGDCPYYNYEGSNLTQEQQTELNTLRDEYRAMTGKIRDQLRDKNYELRTELNKSELNENKVKQLGKEISGLRADMDSARIDHTLKVKKIVPDAQPGFSGRDGRHRGEAYSGCYGGFKGTGPRGTF